MPGGPMTEASAASPLPAPFRDCVAILCCPATGEPLVAGDTEFTAPGRRYPVVDGIPQLFAPVDGAMSAADVTQMVKAFYEETPFPNYADGETPAGLVAKARANLLVSALDEQLPERAVVLEAGCGTGQLTNFLGLSPGRRVFGGDICLNSLGLANGFRRKHAIANAAFLQMNLFRPPFRDDSFDLVICNGVLHHTGDAHAGFTALLRKVKPGGFILVGLYNRWARLPTLWRRWIFARFASAAPLLDRRLAAGHFNEGRRQAWFRDQYQHPHETRHSMGEVLQWFDAEGVDFVSSLPPANGSPFAGDIQLFAPRPLGTTAGRAAAQAKMLLAGGRYGGVFVMVGRKRGRAPASI
jgi:SAM-dependent methyltransferase/uncharacterized protein YbaR (Trm112 family)